MITALNIRNLAVMEDVSLALQPGFCVLTGETGAGKSILIDAIGLVLGARAESDLVRSGAKRAEVIAEFSLSAAAVGWLAEAALDDPDAPDACVIRRIVNADGGSRAFVNGNPASAANLRALGEFLVDIHGQHDSQKLLKPKVQRELLDGFGQYPSELAAVREAHKALQALQAERENLLASDGGSAQQIEFLRFQLDELERVAPQSGEVEQLDAEQRQLANAEQLMQDAHHVAQLLSGSDDTSGAVDAVQKSTDLLDKLTRIDPTFADAHEALEAALVHLQEAAHSTQRRLDQLDLDPQRLQEVDDRLAELHALARKHQCAPEALPSHLEALQTELHQLEHAGERLSAIDADIATATESYNAAAARLTKKRVAAAEKMGTAVTAVTQTLGLPDAQVYIAVSQPDSHASSSHAAFSVHGRDTVLIQITTNPGQAPRPLNKVASGGELSRLSLAIQIVAVGDALPGTLIFDEVDAGIGGGVAEMVGARLRELSAHAQVLCVTHSPQVAAQGTAQFHIRKQVSGGQTKTSVDALAPEQRIEELARMLGGVDLTDQSRAHAQEMLQRAA